MSLWKAELLSQTKSQKVDAFFVMFFIMKFWLDIYEYIALFSALKSF